MINTFFVNCDSSKSIVKRIKEVVTSKIGIYSIGPYAASLAYNSVMHSDLNNILLAPRKGRDLFGAFNKESIDGMDQQHLNSVYKLSVHLNGSVRTTNTLEYLIENCELVLIASNSSHVENDLLVANDLRERLNRRSVVLAILAGSFSYDKSNNTAYLLTERFPNIAFFSGFHRHGALRSPLDSFTSNFCHPNSVDALIGAHILNKISPNIQVSPGIHNIEAQYIKSAKNMSSILAGFSYFYHQHNTGILPTIINLLQNQCLDQAATVSFNRVARDELYNSQPFSLSELGYGVERIEASLTKDKHSPLVRDHTFTQLNAIVSDVRGSMMLPVSGSPTRNFEAGVILAKQLMSFNRLPKDISEFEDWCSNHNINIGSLEGLKSLRYWPLIMSDNSIPLNDCSLVNLLYLAFYGSESIKSLVYDVLTKSRELSSYCQESVRQNHKRTFNDALYNIHNTPALYMIANSIQLQKDTSKYCINQIDSDDPNHSSFILPHLKLLSFIESYDFIQGNLS